MQCHESNAHFQITLEAYEHEDLEGSPVTFTFTKRAGNLIDVTPTTIINGALERHALALAVQALKIESLYWRIGEAHENFEPIFA